MNPKHLPCLSVISACSVVSLDLGKKKMPADRQMICARQTNRRPAGHPFGLRFSLEKELERHLNSSGVVRLRTGSDLTKGRLAGIQVDCSPEEQGMVKGVEEFRTILEFLFPFAKPCLFDDADVPVVDVRATDVTETNRKGTDIR